MLSAEDFRAKWQENPMLKPRVEKVVVNCSVGKSGEPLEKAMKIIEQLTGQKPCFRRAKKTIRDFGIRRKEPMACVVTLRGERAVEFLKRALEAVDRRIPASSFDRFGNFSFGIREHIDIPGTKYSPDLGIIGMDICVSLGRAGYRVKYRRRAKSKIGSKHKLTAEEAMAFMREELGVEITGDGHK
ncbi:MAG: 50S ribosomal protein L5 [Candidatus Bathyarchaeia archaeon]|nr:50S ribosomal protein L5 [Candidatus Bathyarchaeota archaeon]